MIHFELSDQVRAELEWACRHHSKAYMRVRCLALLALLQGQRVGQVCTLFGLSHRTLEHSRRRVMDSGLGALLVKPGRGRKARHNPEQLSEALRRGPGAFGLNRRRWTLRLLCQTPGTGAEAISESALCRALARMGYAYKRAQPVVHSPDPGYGAKKRVARGPRPCPCRA